ncbi:MAG: tetratricopeptide repeat protein, partial [Candidatus Omnitrophica bacterium]|nr:tetratricopeptide repeat protein [Candidatus Omnitrophota bacterium]
FLDLKGPNADIHYNLALIYDQVKKDAPKAIKHYKEYLRLNPDALDIYEIKMRIESLQRSPGTRNSNMLSMNNVNTNVFR